MCLFPKKIRNNKISFNSVVDRVYNLVPCGHCPECADRIRNDYVCRSIAQHLDNTSKGGYTIYVTLTFDEKHVPRLNGQRCFSVSILQKFHKRFRKSLDSYTSDSISYLVSSEFGEHNTKRPHHHALYFVPGSIVPDVFRKCLTDSWQQGHVYFGYHKGVVNSVHALTYVSKYLSKDYGLQNLYSAPEYQDPDKDLTFNNIHLQSVGFGSTLKDYCTKDSYITGKINLPSFSNKSDDEPYRTYNLPLYIERKYMYERYTNLKGTVSYRLNKFGAEIMSLRKSLEYENFRLAYENFSQNFETFVFPFEKDSSLLSDIRELINSTSPFDLFCYRSFARYTHRDFFHFTEQSDLAKFYDLKLNQSYNEIADTFELVKHSVFTDLEFEYILYFFDYFQRFYFYQSYDEKCRNYNSLQNYRLLTGKYKMKNGAYEVKYIDELSFDDYMSYFGFYDSLKHSYFGSLYSNVA